MSEATRIVDCAASTPVGQTVRQTVLLGPTEKLEPRACRLEDARGESIGTARVGGLGAETYGYERLVALAAATLRRLRGERPPEPLFLVAPPPGRADHEPQAADLLREVARRAEFGVDVEASMMVRGEQSAGARAVDFALRALGAGVESVVVGGADSYLHPGVLADLDEAHRLHAHGVEDGFIPGEAAAFVRLRRGGHGPTVASVAFEADEASVAGPDTARVMTELLRGSGPPTGWVLDDRNGERHRQRWWRLVSARGTVTTDVAELSLPRWVGDVGAATGPLALAVAATSWELEVAPADHCAILLSDEGPGRGVIRLEAP